MMGLMNIRVTVVGQLEPRNATWPDGWPAPQEGEVVHLGDGEPLHVRTVAYYPEGKPDEGIIEPFVYVVLGPRRGVNSEWIYHGVRPASGSQGSPSQGLEPLYKDLS